MSDTTSYQQGVRAGLATAALALGAVSFVNLLGLEKSVLTVVLALLALRGTIAPPRAQRRARAAILLAAAQMLIFAVLISVFHERLAHLIQALEKLG
jgi:hypothetical protein